MPAFAEYCGIKREYRLLLQPSRVHDLLLLRGGGRCDCPVCMAEGIASTAWLNRLGRARPT